MYTKAAKRPWHLIVLAVAAVGCSDSSGSSTAKSPGAPSKLVASPLGGGVHLTWSDNSDDEELFEIERKQGDAFEAIDTVPFDTALYHDSSVSLGERYTYRVRAKLPGKFSDYSNEATVDLADGSGGSSASGGKSGTAGSAGKGNASGSGSNNGGTDAVGGDAAGGDSGNQAGSGTAGSGTAGSGTAGSGGTPNTPVSFKKDVAPLLVKTCGSSASGCHNSDQAVGRNLAQFGPCKVIWFAAVDGPVGATFTSGPNQGQSSGCPDLDLYERLMEQHSMLCDAPSWEQRSQYVVPGNLDKSLLYQVIAGDASMGGACMSEGKAVRKMPLIDLQVNPEGVALDAAGVAKIRDWIVQGAKNN